MRGNVPRVTCGPPDWMLAWLCHGICDTGAMSVMTIHLLRHGEVHNPRDVLYGRLPGYVLSSRGHLMAERVAQELRDGDHQIDLVLASPLERAQQTARPIAEAFGLPVGIEDRIIEADNSFEGTTGTDRRRQFANPKYWGRYVNPFRPSWGEPYVDLVARMIEAVRAARQELSRRQGAEAVLVSHQLPIWSTRLFLERRRLWHDPRKRQCSLASLTSLRFNGERLVGLSYWEPAADLLIGAHDLHASTPQADPAVADPAAAPDSTAGMAQQ